MQELVKELTEKIGLNEQDAAKAAAGVLEYLKTKMPSFLHGSLDSAFDGQDVQDSVKEQASEMLAGAKDKLEDFAGDVKDKLSGLFGK